MRFPFSGRRGPATCVSDMCPAAPELQVLYVDRRWGQLGACSDPSSPSMLGLRSGAVAPWRSLWEMVVKWCL